MLRVLTRMMAACGAPAFRRGVALAMILGLVAGPMLNTLTTRHAEEARAAVAGLTVAFSDPGGVLPDALAAVADETHASAGGKASAPADASAMDHSCHGCAAVVLPVVDAAPAGIVAPVRVASAAASFAGRTVPTEIRPPCA